MTEPAGELHVDMFVRPKMSDADWYWLVDNLQTDELKLLVKLINADVLAKLSKIMFVQGIIDDRRRFYEEIEGQQRPENADSRSVWK
jgi:hypothetical protein